MTIDDADDADLFDEKGRMDGFPGYSLEDYLKWKHDELDADVVEEYEPMRDDIEEWLQEFDPEDLTWEEYASEDPFDEDET